MEQRQKETRRTIKKKTFEPNLLRVVLLNDDVTTFDFVIRLLMEVFFYTHDDAVAMAGMVDREGRGEVGVYPADVALSKTEVAIQMARSNNFPLRIITENV